MCLQVDIILSIVYKLNRISAEINFACIASAGIGGRGSVSDSSIHKRKGMQFKRFFKIKRWAKIPLDICIALS